MTQGGISVVAKTSTGGGWENVSVEGNALACTTIQTVRSIRGWLGNSMGTIHIRTRNPFVIIKLH